MAGSNPLDCLELRRRYGVKHRSLKAWTGWAMWLSTLLAVAWAYNKYVFVPAFSADPQREPRSLGSLLKLHAVDEMRAIQEEVGNLVQAATAPGEQPRRQGPRAKRSQGKPPAAGDTAAGTAATTTTATADEAAPAKEKGATTVNATELFERAYGLFKGRQWGDAAQHFERRLAMGAPSSSEASSSASELLELDASMHALAVSYGELGQLDEARKWTDALYQSGRIAVTEPAYHMCRLLRERGHNTAAYHYYLLARTFPRNALPGPAAEKDTAVGHGYRAYFTADDAVHDHLLDYEKSILWCYVGGLDDRYLRLHGVAHSMRLLEKEGLPGYLRNSVHYNLQFYAPPLPGPTTILHAERSTQEEWRFSTPTFLLGNDNGAPDVTLIRVVNYYVAEDGSYHVSPGQDKVNTRLMVEGTGEYVEVALSEGFRAHADADHLVHPDSYIQGLEDTRVVRDAARGDVVYTLSASEQYSEDARIMNQVLGVLDLDCKTLTVQNVIEGPAHNRHDKNWVFAGGLDKVVYDWYPSIEVGAIGLEDSKLRIHTTIRAPPSFEGMRGSTNGVLHRNQWWFVTHTVIHRPEQMRKYLHRLVVLDATLSAVVRYSLPFTFEPDGDVEYCLGLKVHDHGLVFGYSVRDRCSRVRELGWADVGELFDYY